MRRSGVECRVRKTFGMMYRWNRNKRDEVQLMKCCRNSGSSVSSWGGGFVLFTRPWCPHQGPFEKGRDDGVGLGFDMGLSLNRGRGGLLEEQIGWPPGRQQQRSANETTKRRTIRAILPANINILRQEALCVWSPFGPIGLPRFIFHVFQLTPPPVFSPVFPIAACFVAKGGK
jgi:hypothetical protein